MNTWRSKAPSKLVPDSLWIFKWECSSHSCMEYCIDKDQELMPRLQHPSLRLTLETWVHPASLPPHFSAHLHGWKGQNIAFGKIIVFSLGPPRSALCFLCAEDTTSRILGFPSPRRMPVYQLLRLSRIPWQEAGTSTVPQRPRWPEKGRGGPGLLPLFTQDARQLGPEESGPRPLGKTDGVRWHLFRE